MTVTWNASGPAANVKISLSTDGGNTFPTVLAASTANDGSESVLIPDMPTTTARIKVEAVGNIYFDISDTISALSPASQPNPNRLPPPVHLRRLQVLHAGLGGRSRLPGRAVVRAPGTYFPANGRFYSIGGRSADVAGTDFTHPSSSTRPPIPGRPSLPRFRISR